MSTPKVAATILTRNRRDLLRQSLDAVLGQTRPVDHLIVVDNESSDGTVDMLASESVLFTHAIAPSSWTLPSHAYLFTGKFPQSHGAGYDAEGSLRITDAIAGPAEWTQYRVRGLAEKEATLAALLKGAGYRTGAVVGGPWMKRIFGLEGASTTLTTTGSTALKGVARKPSRRGRWASPSARERNHSSCS